MRFNKIKYTNYRCFINSELQFDINNDKNIILIVAPNGGGKTEIAFSFWWVLYSFDFKSLRGKKMTAYSLNSELYKQLQTSQIGTQQSCSVELEFTADDGRIYTIKRSETFTKKPASIASEQSVELFHINSDGTKSLPLNNADDIEQILSRMIPQKILAGLIFDGERMQQLNDEDQKAAEAIEGVIKHVTNEALFELCTRDLMDIKKDNQKALTKTEKSLNKTSNSSVEAEIQTVEQLIMRDDILLHTESQNYEKALKNIEEAKNELSKYQQSQKFELLRQKAEKDLKIKQNTLQAQIEIFYKDLDKGFLLITPKLIEDTKKNIEVYDVPTGLTTEAVKSILKRDHCICGHSITDLEKSNLTQLLSSLPPDNISSTILEMTRHIESSRDDASTLISRTFESISQLETDIADIKNNIAHLSTQITKGAPGFIKKFEKQHEDNISKRDSADKKIQMLNKSLSDNKILLDKLKETRNAKSKLNEEYNYYSKKQSFTEKCLQALYAIDEYNKILSLESINILLNKAYEQLSSDFKLGRRLHIITYDSKQRYSLHSYTQEKIKSLIELQKAEIETWKMQGKKDSEIKELLIMKDSISGSTGQSKVNSLAFAKAILDYSSNERDKENIIEIKRSYPFLIDSPFTELDDENQSNIAKNIMTYSDQIILLASQKSMNGIEEIIIPHVSNYYEISKLTSEHTQIKLVNNVNICR